MFEYYVLKKFVRKGLLMAMFTAAFLMGTASGSRVYAQEVPQVPTEEPSSEDIMRWGGYVCVGGTMYKSWGFWIFQIPYGAPLEDAPSCKEYAD